MNITLYVNNFQINKIALKYIFIGLISEYFD